MKEDAQLICPLAYEDGYGVWENLNKDLSAHFPLRHITWKSPLSTSSLVTIDKLSVRCIPSGANLFKDTDHPFRWFLAPYVNIYVFVCDTYDSYKGRRAKLKQWLDSLTGPKRSSWLVIYMPMGSQPLEVYQKIYSKLSTDIYFDKVGDRTAMIISGSQQNRQNNSFTDIVEKIKDGIVNSFQQRCSLYDAEIHRLDAMRGTPQLDFRQLFLVKESLALMFQMMQLPGEALFQYEELESLLAYAPTHSIPITEWPLVPVEHSSSSKQPSKTPEVSGKEKMNNTNVSSAGQSNGNPSEHDPISSDLDNVPMWMCACQQGLSLLRYSINHARMKVLKNQIGLLELQHYVFSRICFFLLALARPAQCAERGYQFLSSIRNKIQVKFDAIEEKEENEEKDDPKSQRSLSLEQLNVVMLDGKRNAMNLNGISSATQRSNMADLWVITGAIQLTKKCRDTLSASLAAQKKKELNHSKSRGGHAVKNKESDEGPASIDKTSNSFLFDETIGIKIKSLARSLIDLLTLAKSKLSVLICHNSLCRRISLDMALVMWQWDDYDELVGKFSNVFSRKCNEKSENRSFCFPSDSLDETISAFQKKMQILMQYQSEFTQEELHSDSVPSQDSTEGLFVSRCEIIDLETDIFVILLRLLIESQEISGRWRFVCYSLLECADILMANGKFQLAMYYLRGALEGTVTTPESILSNNITPPCGTLIPWPKIRVLTLQKLLLCSRVLNDRQMFISTSMLLLDSMLRPFLSDDKREKLQANVVAPIAPDPSFQIVQDTSFHFDLKVSMDVPSNLKQFGECSDIPTLKPVQNSRLIHDEMFNINLANCSAGQTHCIFLHLISNFPATLAVEELSVVYAPFLPNSVQSLEEKTSSLSIDGGRGSSVGLTFSSLPFADHYGPDDGKLHLHPGENVFRIKFDPPSCGLYSLSEVNVKMNSYLLLSKKIIPEINKLQPFLESNTLVEVTAPTDALAIHPFPATFTPVGHKDVGGVYIRPRSSDRIVSLFIYTSCVKSVDQPREECQDLPEASDVLVDPPKNWIVQSLSLADHKGEPAPMPDLTIKNGGLLMSNVSQDISANLKVPFTALQTVQADESCGQLPSEHDLLFVCEGKLIRNNCIVEFKTQVKQRISVGIPIVISQQTTELFDEEYFCQCELRNISSFCWRVFDFEENKSVSSSDAKSHDKVSFKLVDGEDMSTLHDRHADKSFILLQPEESYSIALRLRKTECIAPLTNTSSFQKLSGCFQIQRNFDASKATSEVGYYDDIYQYLNQKLFMLPLTVSLPLDTSLVYSLDYLLHVSSSLPLDSQRYLIGVPLSISYELEVIFPRLGVEDVTLVLSISHSKDWSMFGTSRKVCHCSRKQSKVSVHINLVPVAPGCLPLPPLQVSAYGNDQDLQASCRQQGDIKSDTIEVISNAPDIVVCCSEHNASIFSLPMMPI